MFVDNLQMCKHQIAKYWHTYLHVSVWSDPNSAYFCGVWLHCNKCHVQKPRAVKIISTGSKCFTFVVIKEIWTSEYAQCQWLIHTTRFSLIYTCVLNQYWKHIMYRHYIYFISVKLIVSIIHAISTRLILMTHICIIIGSDNGMMTSSNGNILRVTGHLCGEFTGPRWIPLTKARDAELWCLPWSAPE